MNTRNESPPAPPRRPLSAISSVDRRRSAHLRECKSYRFRPFQINEIFADFVRKEIIPKLDLGTKCLAAKHRLVIQITANLFLASKAGKTVADSRNTGKSGVRMRSDVYDQMKQAGLVIMQLGSEQSKKVTRYGLSVLGTRMCRKHDFHFDDIVDLNLDRLSQSKRPSESTLVVLRDAEGQPKPFPRMKRAERQLIETLENAIDAINQNNLRNHTWIFYREVEGRLIADQPNVMTRAIFNQDFQHGGRLYSWTVNGFTHLSKAERRTMLIDVERIVELDFSGFHTRILYHKTRIDFQGDVYQPHEVFPEVFVAEYYNDRRRKSFWDAARKLAKAATNIILNARDEKSASGAVRKAIRENRQYSAITYNICRTNPVAIVRRIKELHAPIANHFHTGVGARLQAEDVWLMLDILTQFMNAGKAGLGLHDGVICKRSDTAFAKHAMESSYFERYGFHPDVKQAFPKS